MAKMTWKVSKIGDDGIIAISIMEDGTEIYVHNMPIRDINNAKIEIQTHCDDIYDKILTSRAVSATTKPLDLLIGLSG